MDVLSGQDSRFPKKRSENTHVTKKKCYPIGAQRGYWFPDSYLEMKEQELKKMKRNMADQAKCVEAKMKEAKKLILKADMAALKNVPDDEKVKILSSYKKINVKPFKIQKLVELEDVDDE